MMLASQHSTAQRLIHILLRQLGPGAELIEAQEREWASATFNGARHILHFRLPLLAAAAAPPVALAGLADHEFTLPGQIVADCLVSSQRRQCDKAGLWSLHCTVELLTIAAD